MPPALRSRSKLWSIYEPTDAAGREIVRDMHKDCRAVECKGPPFCERDNRSVSCRAFPFYPYMTKDDELIGLTTSTPAGVPSITRSRWSASAAGSAGRGACAASSAGSDTPV